MPIKSKVQGKFIWWLRNKFKNKSDTPEKSKWIWDDKWFKGINFKSLPDRIKKEK